MAFAHVYTNLLKGTNHRPEISIFTCYWNDFNSILIELKEYEDQIIFFVWITLYLISFILFVFDVDLLGAGETFYFLDCWQELRVEREPIA